MAAEREANTTEPSQRTSQEASSGAAETPAAPFTGLSDNFTSALEQLSQLEADLARRVADFERREQELAAQQRELEARAGKLDAQRERLERCQAESQTKLEHLEAQRQQLASQQAELTRRADELGARESAMRAREENAAKYEQELSQIAREFGEENERWTAPSECPASTTPPLSDSVAADPAASPLTEAEAATLEAIVQNDVGDTAGTPTEPESELAAGAKCSGVSAAAPAVASELLSDMDPTPPSSDDGEVNAADAVDLADLTQEELEKVRILRRLRPDLSDAGLVARVRAERQAGSDTTSRGRKPRKSKRGWFR